MEKNLNEYDFTKKMQSTIRNMREAHSHSEGLHVENEEEIESEVDVNVKKEPEEEVIDDEEYTTLSDKEIDDEIKNFKESVGGVSSFNEFKVTEGNIKWSGMLDNENIEWLFILNENDGIYIKTPNTKLTDEVIDRINKLRSYYDVWTGYWSNEVNR